MDQPGGPGGQILTTITGGLTVKSAAIACLICFVLGGLFGAWAWDTIEAAQQRLALALAQKDLANEKAKPPIVRTIEGKSEVRTEVAYVPKEVVRYIDQKTGKEIAEPEKVDADIKIGKPEFTVKLNGQERTFTRADDEQFLFEKNKLAVNQTSRIGVTIDDTKLVDALVAERAKAERKHFGAAVWYFNDQKLGAEISFTPGQAVEYKYMKRQDGDGFAIGLRF